MKRVIWLYLIFGWNSVSFAADGSDKNFFSTLPDSKILQKSPTSVQLIKGSVRIGKECKGLCEVLTAFGEISAESEIWISDQQKKIKIIVLTGTAKITLKNREVIELNAGEQVWVAGLDASGRSVVGVPEEMNLRDAMALEKHSFSGSVKELKKHAEVISSQWSQIRKQKQQDILEQSKKSVSDSRSTNDKLRRPASAIIESEETGSTDRSSEIKALYYKKVFEQ